jgi:hypothetical protein
LQQCFSQHELSNLKKIMDEGSFIDTWTYHTTDIERGVPNIGTRAASVVFACPG